MDKSFAPLFAKKPSSWGLRGDPFLWQSMADYLQLQPLPDNTDEFITKIQKTFYYLTQHTMDEERFFKIEKFKHGGMSSGMIDPKFWRQNIMPLLLERFETLFK